MPFWDSTMGTLQGSTPGPDANDTAAEEILSQIRDQIAAIREKVQRARIEVGEQKGWLPADKTE